MTRLRNHNLANNYSERKLQWQDILINEDRRAAPEVTALVARLALNGLEGKFALFA